MKVNLKCMPEALMNETPSVIGMMSVTLSSGGSFDSAIREIAKSGPKNISALFTRIVLDADCRAISDIRTAVIDMVEDTRYNLFHKFRQVLGPVLFPQSPEH